MPATFLSHACPHCPRSVVGSFTANLLADAHSRRHVDPALLEKFWASAVATEAAAEGSRRAAGESVGAAGLRELALCISEHTVGHREMPVDALLPRLQRILGGGGMAEDEVSKQAFMSYFTAQGLAIDFNTELERAASDQLQAQQPTSEALWDRLTNPTSRVLSQKQSSRLRSNKLKSSKLKSGKGISVGSNKVRAAERDDGVLLASPYDGTSGGRLPTSEAGV